MREIVALDEGGTAWRFEVWPEGDEVVLERYREGDLVGRREQYTALEAANLGAAMLRASGAIEYLTPRD
jgi:hypothetical protein